MQGCKRTLKNFNVSNFWAKFQKILEKNIYIVNKSNEVILLCY